MRSISTFAITLAAAGAAFLAPASAQDAPKARASRVMVSHGGSFLGVGAIDIDEDRAKALNLKEARGVEIKSVEENSPAAKAGVKEGDVVLDFNGQHVEGSEQFARLVRETPSGRQVQLSIWRNGAPQTLTATIGTRSGYYMHGPDVSVIAPPMPPMPPMPPNVSDEIRERMQEMTGRNMTLGVETESLTPQLADFFGVKDGALVRSVVKNSPAEKAGIKAGDVIVKVDDAKVATPRDLIAHLRTARSKKTFPVTVVRKQQEQTFTVTVEERRGLRVSPGPAKVYC